MPRFPFTGFPKGWFAVAFSSDVPLQRVVSMRYFGRDLIAYRGESGRVCVTDAYCPHLGAHLAHGGVVLGDTIRCPFHGWRFEDGRCVGVPYTDKTPKAKIASFPVREQNGVIHAFYDPDGGAPWDLPVLDDEGWTEGKTVLWPRLRTHPQEIFENTVDMAHIGPVHAGRDAAIIGKPERDGHKLFVALEFQAPGDVVGMPGTINDVHLEVTLHGLGAVFVQTHVRNVAVRARQRIYATPIDEDTLDIRGVVHVQKSDDAVFTADLARIFYDAYVEDFAKDFPIWENKRYLTRPMLAQGDGPIPLYRKWCEQFYPTAKHAVASAANGTATNGAENGAQKRRLSLWLEPMREKVQQKALELASMLRSEARRPVAKSSSPSEPSAPKVAPRASIASVEEYFDTLEQRFVPSAAAGVDAVFQWELAGDGGGVYHAHVHDRRVDVRRGAHEAASVCLAMSADDYVRIVNGELDGISAFTSGRSKVRGSIPLAMKMRTLFPA